MRAHRDAILDARFEQREEASLARRVKRLRVASALAMAALVLGACSPKTYMPELATEPYPRELHTPKTVDMQVFRRGTEMEIVNSTARSYTDITVWINQRYMLPMKSLQAGETRRVSLWDFFDEYGDRFYAGGLFRAYPATPLRLVEIQTTDDQPMVGLITIRSEEIKPITKQ